jgi:nucleotide-binding universal stress UspA family protein
MGTILIAMDGSASSAEAVRLGLELAEEQGAKPVFAHVVEALDIPPAAGFGWPSAVPHEPTDEERRPLQDAVALAQERGIEAEAAVLRGTPIHEIVVYAEQIDADLIVVGSRGHGALASALLGSVSLGVLHQARRPVLIVRSASEAAAV